MKEVSKHHKRAVHSMLILVEGTDKNLVDTGLEGIRYAPVLPHCSLLRNT
jgi:hypothetical protein